MWPLVVLLAALWQDPPAPLTPEVQDARRLSDCLFRLRGAVIDVRVPVRCRLDGHGAPSDCRAPDDIGLGLVEQEAAVCMAETYRLRRPDGTLATDMAVTIHVRLRMNVAPPPSGFVPPGG